MAQVRPRDLSMAQCLGSHSSTDLSRIAAAARANSSTGMGLKHQLTTDWLIRPFSIFQLASACGFACGFASSAFVMEGPRELAAMMPAAEVRSVRRERLVFIARLFFFGFSILAFPARSACR